MDPKLFNMVDNNTPKFNDEVCRGYAVSQMKELLSHMDAVFRSAEKLFPEGLVYKGRKIASPLDRFTEWTRPFQNKREVDVSRHDYIMVRYFFEYKGESLGSGGREGFPVLIPFVREGGLFVHRGTQYSIVPALTDIGYSVTRDGLFVAFKRTRHNFHMTSHNVNVDGNHEVIHLYWSALHHEISKSKGKKSLLRNGRPYIHSTLPHYFFCKWGFVGALERFNRHGIKVIRKKDINPKEYPKRDYHYFRSVALNGVWDSHPNGDIYVLAPKATYDAFIGSVIGSFFYVMDAFPDYFDDFDGSKSNQQGQRRGIEDPTFWRVLLGRIVKGDNRNQGEILNDINSHMTSTDKQLDELTQASLRERGIAVNDIYELCYEIMTTLADCFLTKKTNEASMYDKRLTVVPYVTQDFNTMITTMVHSLSNKKKKEPTAAKFNEIIGRHIKLSSCIRSISTHGEVVAVVNPGDNLIHRITSVLVDPADAGPPKKGGSKKGNILTDSAHLLHASIAEVGSFNNLPKSSPDGRARINPCVKVGPTGVVQRKEHLRELIDGVQEKLEFRKT